MTNEVAGAAVEASRALLDLSLQTPGFKVDVKIDNNWLAAGLVGATVVGALSLGAFYVHRRYPSENAIRAALQGNEHGVVDPEVRAIENGSILVELFCHTEHSFLSFVDHFEAKRTKFRLEEEFRKIGYGEELMVTINNLDEVHGKLNQIRHKFVRQATTYQCEGKYVEAKQLYERAVDITTKIGRTKGQNVEDDLSLEEYIYGNLGTVLGCLCNYSQAEKTLQKALEITREIGDRRGEASASRNLGIVFQYLAQYSKAIKYLEKGLSIALETGDRKEEAFTYRNLGNVFQSLGECVKAREYLEKAVAMGNEIGDKQGQAAAYGSLGPVFASLGDYGKAEEYLEKALAISKEIGDKNGEASACGNLGMVHHSLGKYIKAKEYLEKTLKITLETGDRREAAFAYGNLGNVFHSLGEFVEAEKYLVKALTITGEIGDRKGEASAYGNLGTVFHSLGKYSKAEEFLKKALAIREEIGDRKGLASSFANLGTVFQSLGEYAMAKGYLEKALAVTQEIGDRNGEASAYGNLGTVFQCLGEYVMAEDCTQKALRISKEIGVVEKEFYFLFNLACLAFLEGKMEKTLRNLMSCIRKGEEMRGLCEENDQFKISFSEEYVFRYWMLCTLLCVFGRPQDALYVSELGRARGLADVMSARYSLKNQISADPHSWVGMENVMKKESKCTCLYFAYSSRHIFLWVLKTSGVMFFREIDLTDTEGWEDGLALYPFLGVRPQLRSHQEDNPLAIFRPIVEEMEEEEEEEIGGSGSEENLNLYYKMIIAPVVHLLEEPEIVVVPDRSLYQVPFAALRDETGKYLSESFRIRIVPSLTTLKLIQDSSVDYHSHTGALIVGDPKVGRVYYKGRVEKLCPLPSARHEAEMIGRLLGTQPLLGEHATKQAVLQRMDSVSLIHFATHGDAQRGEIALAPLPSAHRLPKEEDYVLTVAEILQVQLRAKLVVLSCCHSGIRENIIEEIVGFARAFLGCGARSVLVALWALEDKATMTLMSRFYHHLALGESASESLHQAMKWMRSNGFSDVKDWAPFILIGDNVKFDFGQ